MSYEMQGTVKVLMDEEELSNNFRKREVVIDTGGEYPQMIKVEFLKDRISQLDGLSAGDSVTVHFDLRGREWNGKYFSNVVGWKLDKGASGSYAAPDRSPATMDEPPF